MVGAGPAGLAAAIRLKQRRGRDLGVRARERAEIGAHILSGAVMDPRALNELIPDWKEKGAPLNTPVTEDRFSSCPKAVVLATPGAAAGCFRNHGNYIVSLGNVCRWLGEQAEALGVEIFPASPREVLYNEDGAVKGVATGDMGIGKDGRADRRYQPGMELHAKYTFFAEGCRGHLAQLMERFKLRDGVDPQVYGIGLKELWEVPPASTSPVWSCTPPAGRSMNDTYGGSFLYHLEDNLVAVGFVSALATEPVPLAVRGVPALQDAPAIRGFFEGGKRIAYGARAITDGGLQSLPKLVFPGGALIGETPASSTLPRIKGSHTAIKSGMLAAEAAFAALEAGTRQRRAAAYPRPSAELASTRSSQGAQLQALDVQGACSPAR